MKCLILAGGFGTRMWPLSRTETPKQFVRIHKDHSMLQETVSRNLPFCDEFIILTNAKFRFIAENQMKVFQGTPYQIIAMEENAGILNAAALACMSLAQSEYVFMVPCDHLISNGSVQDAYKNSILQAKDYAAKMNTVLFTQKETEIHPSYGYVTGLREDGSFAAFTEKPDAQQAKKLVEPYRNLGMYLFTAGSFLSEINTLYPETFRLLQTTYRNGTHDENAFLYNIEGSTVNYGYHDIARAQSNLTYYTKQSLSFLPDLSFVKDYIAKTEHRKALACDFTWKQIDTAEDLSSSYLSQRNTVLEKCENTEVINDSKQVIVGSGLKNLLVCDTPDALYICEKGKSAEIQNIIRSRKELQNIADTSSLSYRPWGSYVTLDETADSRVRKVTIPGGSHIPSHHHTDRSETITITSGKARITLNDISKEYTAGDTIFIMQKVDHEIANPAEENLVFIETASGNIASGASVLTRAERKENDTLPMIKLAAAYKDYLWGGTKLRDVLKMPCDYDVISEAWMMSAHKAGPSIVLSSNDAGMHFPDYIHKYGQVACGWKCSSLQNFPMLVKLIDAKDNLSVQVHPDDDYALANENEYGKNEMWYVLDCEPGSGLYVGFNKDMTKDQVRTDVNNGTIIDDLNFFETKPGDVFFIPAGTVHAIGKGNLIAEIQQSSNCTYRLYDYKRKDKYGHERELHLDKALDVMNTHKYIPAEVEQKETGTGTVLASCKYFESEIHEVRNEDTITIDDGSFRCIVCLSGQGTLSLKDTTLNMHQGETIFVPAQNANVQIHGNMKLIVSHV